MFRFRLRAYEIADDSTRQDARRNLTRLAKPIEILRKAPYGDNTDVAKLP